MKTLTFSNISVITEDIYLKLRVGVHYQKGTHTSIFFHFFLTKLCPFFDLEFSKCSYSRALAPACGALVCSFSLRLACSKHLQRSSMLAFVLSSPFL